MLRRRHRPEQVIRKLREAEAEQSRGWQSRRPAGSSRSPRRPSTVGDGSPGVSGSTRHGVSGNSNARIAGSGSCSPIRPSTSRSLVRPPRETHEPRAPTVPPPTTSVAPGAPTATRPGRSGPATDRDRAGAGTPGPMPGPTYPTVRPHLHQRDPMTAIVGSRPSGNVIRLRCDQQHMPAEKAGRSSGTGRGRPRG